MVRTSGENRRNLFDFVLVGHEVPFERYPQAHVESMWNLHSTLSWRHRGQGTFWEGYCHRMGKGNVNSQGTHGGRICLFGIGIWGEDGIAIDCTKAVKGWWP
jgi:hypothetical protein